MSGYLLALGALGAAGALFLLWRRRMDGLIAESADMEWERLQKRDPDLLKGLTREGFDRIYALVEYPRLPGHLLAIFAGVTLLTPVIVLVLQVFFALTGGDGTPPEIADAVARLVVDRDGKASVVAGPSDQAQYYAEDLSGFGLYFGLILGWLAIVALVMHRYHSRRTGTLREEIIRARP